MIHNSNFKVVEFDHFRISAGVPSFVLSASEWIERTKAIGILVKKGRYGGTYAHKDIAFEFGSAISVSFKLYLIEEFQRLLGDVYRIHPYKFTTSQVEDSNEGVAGACRSWVPATVGVPRTNYRISGLARSKTWPSVQTVVEGKMVRASARCVDSSV